MRAMVFAGRTRRELMRDPLSLLFALALPLALIFLMSAMYKNVPEMAAGAPQFSPVRFAPGISILSLSFISLFTGMLVAGDRESALLIRLGASPMTGANFIVGYTLPLLPAAAAQTAVCFAGAAVFGLEFSPGFLLGVVILVPAGLLFTGIGLLLGCLLTYKQVGGVGSILVQVATLLGGTWFDLSLLGGAVESVAYCLPFAHAVEMARAAVDLRLGEIWPHMLWVLGWTAVVYAAAALLFRRRRRG